MAKIKIGKIKLKTRHIWTKKTKIHRDKTKYIRKTKYKKEVEEIENEK